MLTHIMTHQYIAALSGLLIPGIIVAVVVAVIVLALVVTSRWKTAAPNTILVRYGRKYSYSYADAEGKQQTGERGFKTITGGGAFIVPVVEQYQLMSTAAFQVAIQENGVPTAKNVPVAIEAMATCRISPNPDEQANAVQAFLGKTPDMIAGTISQILRGHVRSIIAGLTVEQILRDRSEFNKKVLEESSDEFKKLGVQIVTLVVQDVSDEVGYIAALGKQETAATIRDAAIATAVAEKETKIKVSDAQREASEVAANNAAKVADAEKKRDINIAQFKTETETKRAEADMANAIAKAQQEKSLRVVEADRDARAAEAGIAVQEKLAILNQKELEATVITKARAERDAAIIRADAGQEVAKRTASELEIKAEGTRAALVKEADGVAAKTRTIAAADAEATRATRSAQAEGDKAVQLAAAEGVKANQLALADGTRANLLAVAEGEEKKLLATAKGKEASLLAEAKGTRELAEALKQLNEKGQLLMILDRVPVLLREGGEAGAKIVSAAFGPMGESLASIKNVSIVDMGGGKDGQSGVAKFAGSIPEAIAGMLVKAEAMGIDIKPLMKLLKLDPSKLGEMIGLVGSVVPDEPATEVVATPSTPVSAKGK